MRLSQGRDVDQVEILARLEIEDVDHTVQGRHQQVLRVLFGLGLALGVFAAGAVVGRLINKGDYFLVAEVKTVGVAKGATLLVGNLHRRLHHVLDITGGSSVFVNRLRGEEALKRRLLDLIQPCVLKMVTEVK